MSGVMVKVENADAACDKVASLGGTTKPVFDIAAQGRMAVCFDPNGAESLCRELSALYDFMLQRITEAFVKREPETLEPVQATLRELRASWAELTAAA